MILAALTGATVAAVDRPATALVIAAGCGLWFALAGPQLLRWWASRYVVTDRRLLIIVRGAGIRQAWRWPQVEDVWCDQSWWQRRAGWGTIHLDPFTDDDLDPGDHDEDRDLTGHDRDVPTAPPTRGVLAASVEHVSDPESFRSWCVVGMEIADTPLTDDPRHDLDTYHQLFDDLVERGHLAQREVAPLFDAFRRGMLGDHR